MNCPVAAADGPEPDHSPRFLREWSHAIASLAPESIARLTEYRRRADRPLHRLVDLVEYCTLEECDDLAQLLSGTKRGPLAEERLTGYEKHKARTARRQLEQTRAAQEIGPLPAVVDQSRRDACEFNPERFLLTYFPEAFSLAFGENHHQLIAECKRAVTERRLQAVAMPRGSGKTTICELLCLWAILYGHSRFILFVHANEEKSIEALSHIKDEIELNNTLLADFPEVCYPVRKLDRRTNKARGQLLNGLPTRIVWKDDEIRLPTVAGSVCSGSIIVSAGLGSAVRGANKRAANGQRLRPDFLLIDDPQTDQSAKSREECDIRIGIIVNGLLGVFGPEDQPAGLVPCTVLRKGDVADTLLNRELHPKFHGIRFRMLYGETQRLDLWLQYYDLLKTAEKDDREPTEAHELFVANRVEMEAGMRAGWPARTLGRLSPIQLAMELWLEDPDYFFREMQNDPQDAQQESEAFLRADDIAVKVNNYQRQQAPQFVSQVTAHIDVQGKMLFYMVCGWGEDFTGQVMEYGTWPRQRLTHFTARHAQPTMIEELATLGHVGLSLETSIYRGLDVLFRQLATTKFHRVDGVELRPAIIGVDANNWGKIIKQACTESPFAGGLLPMHADYIGPNETPISQFRQQPGETMGDEWLIKAKGGVQYGKFDVNHWKTFAGRRLATPHPNPGSLTIYGPEGTRHHLLGRHLDSELRNPTQGKRIVDEWKIRPGETENHWWDTLVGCCVLASMRGCKISAAPKAFVPKEEREIVFG